MHEYNAGPDSGFETVQNKNKHTGKTPMTTKLAALQSWVDQVASLTRPDAIRWCNGSDVEYDEFVQKMLADGTLTALNEDSYPNC